MKLTLLQCQVCYTPDHCEQCNYVDIDSLYFMYTSYFWNIRHMMVTNIQMVYYLSWYFYVLLKNKMI